MNPASDYASVRQRPRRQPKLWGVWILGPSRPNVVFLAVVTGAVADGACWPVGTRRLDVVLGFRGSYMD